MKISDFNIQDEQHLQNLLEICEKIVDEGGVCTDIDCVLCPFFSKCALYSDVDILSGEKDHKLLSSCNKFISKFKNIGDLEIQDNKNINNSKIQEGRRYPHCGGLLDE